jgi:hypothetical protein
MYTGPLEFPPAGGSCVRPATSARLPEARPPAADHAFVRKVADWSRRTGVTLVPREAIPEDDMSENSTARHKRNDVDANVESASVVPQTSNMRIRTANGRAHPPRSETRRRRTADDGGPTESPAVPGDSPAGRQRPHATSSTAEASSGQERSGRQARSRRWVQLRNTTTITPDARGTDTAKGGHGAATHDDTKPKTGRRPATKSQAGKRENLRRDVRTKPVEAA